MPKKILTIWTTVLMAGMVSYTAIDIQDNQQGYIPMETHENAYRMESRDEITQLPQDDPRAKIPVSLLEELKDTNDREEL